MIKRLLLIALCVFQGSCCLATVNPATGEKQIDLIGESGEIDYGNKADARLVASIGEYNHPESSGMVKAIGRALTAVSERPNLPWTYRVLDDPVVNAFAIPGGHVYVTRGLLSHLKSQEQLTGVLAHEVGHVTARHSVEQMSRGLLAGLGVGIAGAIDPEGLGGLANAGAQIMFLSHSRKDEYQADKLAVRYIARTEGNPGALLEVFDVLGRVEAEALQGRRLPTLLRTHPQSDERRKELTALIGHMGLESGRSSVDDKYMGMLDGMLFGPNAREGFFVDETLVHPELGLVVDFPASWKKVNQRQQVLAGSPEGDALMRLMVAKTSLDTALDEFEKEAEVKMRRRKALTLNGHPAETAVFEIPAEPGKGVAGWVTYVEHNGVVLQLLGVCLQNQVARFEAPIQASLKSLRTLTSTKAKSVEPMRLQVVKIDRTMSLKDFARRHPSVIDLDTLGIINHVDAAATLPSGALVKRVVGFNPENATREILH